LERDIILEVGRTEGLWRRIGKDEH
jgi:hypothetical protein